MAYEWVTGTVLAMSIPIVLCILFAQIYGSKQRLIADALLLIASWWAVLKFNFIKLVVANTVDSTTAMNDSLDMGFYVLMSLGIAFTLYFLLRILLNVIATMRYKKKKDVFGDDHDYTK